MAIQPARLFGLLRPVSAGAVGFLVYGSDGSIVCVNDVLAGVVGGAAEQIVERPLWRLRADLAENEFDRLWHSLPSGVVEGRRVRVRRPSGAPTTLQSLLMRLDVAGAVFHVSYLWKPGGSPPPREEDTGRDCAIDSLLEQVGVGVLVLDGRGRRRRCNRTFARMGNLPLSQLRDQPRCDSIRSMLRNRVRNAEPLDRPFDPRGTLPPTPSGSPTVESSNSASAVLAPRRHDPPSWSVITRCHPLSDRRPATG